MAITNAQLNAYVETLAKVQTAIENTIASIKSLGSTMNASSAGGFGLLPIANEAEQLQRKLDLLLSTKNQLLSAFPSQATNQGLPFSGNALNNQQLQYYNKARLEAVQRVQKDVLAREISQRLITPNTAAPIVPATNAATTAINQETQAVERLAAKWVDAQGKAMATQMSLEEAAQQVSTGMAAGTPIKPLLKNVPVTVNAASGTYTTNMSTAEKQLKELEMRHVTGDFGTASESTQAFSNLNELIALENALRTAIQKATAAFVEQGKAASTSSESAIRNAPPRPELQDQMKETKAKLDDAMRNATWQAGILSKYTNIKPPIDKNGALITDAGGNLRLTPEEQNQISQWYSDPRYKASREFAQASGFQGIPSFTTVGTSGVKQLDWRQTNDMGSLEKLRSFNTPAGGNIESTSRQFQTLTSAIGRDLRELTKWSIAIALIYGPLNALKTLYADMVENQTRLADSMIALNDSSIKTAEVFDIVKASADAMGTGVSDTINSFTQAYRATGNLGPANERIATSTILLRDSLTLAKLAGMEEATAIDTLSASLRQTNTPLNEGSSLLDKWVKTTQVANVDLQTLSTGFAVLGDAAETAGMSVDEINGLLAAIAETGIGTSKEVANAAKAIVAGFYSDKAVKQLNSLGIATKDAEGNLRDFNSIATEIYQQRQLGLISDTSFQETARDIGGGGNRRQAAVTTLLENYARVQQVAKYSAEASGEAQAAMGRRLDTVQTSTTRVNNAFQSLAMSLGNEGGLLSIFSNILDLTSGITRGFDALISVMGKAGPLLMTTMAGGLLMKSQGPLAASAFGNQVDRMLLPLLGSSYASTAITTNKNPLLGPSKTTMAGGRFIENLFAATPNWTNRIAGGALTAVSAIGNLTNKEDPFGPSKALGNVLGAAIGASLLPMSPIIGMAVGSAIAEAFITQATAKGSMALILSQIGEPGYKGEGVAKYTPDKGTDALYAAIGFGIPAIGKLLAFFPGLGAQMAGGSQDTYAYYAAQDAAKLGIPWAKRGVSTFEQAKDLYKLNNPDAYNLPAYDIDLKQREQMDLYGPALTEMRKKAEAKLLSQVQTGDVTSAEYNRKMDSLSTFEERATKFQAIFGELIIGNVNGINSEMDAYQAFLNLVTGGSSEAIDAITAISTEIYDSKNKLEGLTTSKSLGTDLITIGNETQTKDYWISKLEARIKTLEGMIPGIVQAGNQAASATVVKAPSVVNEGNAYSREDYNKIKAQYRLDEFTRLRQLNPTEGPNAVTDAQINAYLDSQEQFGVYINDFGKYVYELTGGMGGASEEAFNRTASEMVDKGLVTTGTTTKSVSPEVLDINSSQFPLLQQYTNQAMAALRTIPGFTPKEDDLKVFGKDWIGGVIHGDQMALRLALEKLIGIEEKQLDGIYNLPDGSFFSVFLTQEWMKLMQGGNGVGGGPSFGGETTTETNYGMGGGGASNIGGATMPGIRIPKGIGYKYGFLGRSDTGYTSRPENIRPSILDRKYMGEYDEREIAIKEMKQGKYGTPPSYTGVEGIDKFFKLLGITPVGTGWGGGIGNSNAQPVSRTSLNLNTTTTVQLDGRVIASIIKVYLAEDLARMTTGYGKSAKDYIGGG
jgi:TP901 family phage tail tape measure protein